RAGFDEFFPPDRILEGAGGGLTSPILSRFPFSRLPRPVYPIDPETRWNEAAGCGDGPSLFCRAGSRLLQALPFCDRVRTSVDNQCAAGRDPACRPDQNETNNAIADRSAR